MKYTPDELDVVKDAIEGKEEYDHFIDDSTGKIPGMPAPEEKHNVHTFLNKIATSDDTTKTGFLREEELGIPRYPVRSFKDFALISDKVIGNDYIKDYFLAKSENITATSLSREGFLVKQSNTSTKQIADVTKIRKQNKGWFGLRDKKEENQEQQE